MTTTYWIMVCVGLFLGGYVWGRYLVPNEKKPTRPKLEFYEVLLILKRVSWFAILISCGIWVIDSWNMVAFKSMWVAIICMGVFGIWHYELER